MAKKGNRPNKTNQARTREEQWRRRAAAMGAGATSVAEPDVMAQDGAGSLDVAEFTVAETSMSSVAAPRTTGATQTRTSTSAANTAAQRRAATMSRQSRTRYAPQSMSIEDEMYYVRADIRRLILLTAACVAVLIVLYFLLPN